MSKNECMPLLPSGCTPDLQVKTQRTNPARKGPEEPGTIEFIVQQPRESGFWPFLTGLMFGTVAAFVGACLSFAALV